MLDSRMKEQIQEIFSKLEKTVVLRINRSSHPDQPGLLEMLKEISQTSNRVRLEEVPNETRVPRFEVASEGKPARISFRGVPGGHEFSSLLLAILYADGKGKQPDEGIIQRIQNLKGPIRLRTYVSLTCENCPEVVQALSLMATLHDDFQHEMVNGAVAQDEIELLGIQGVPSVIRDNKFIHAGKAQLIDLLRLLESEFGTHQVPDQSETHLGTFEVTVIGGGPAGVSAAIYSARKGVKTALIAERFGGQLQETKGIENMISIPYTEGVQVADQLKQHLSKYPVHLYEHRRVTQVSDGSIKRVHLEGGEVLDSKSVIIATGAKWRELGIPGEKEHIGRGVAYCAHCDGPFYRGKKVAVVGGGNSGVEAAIDLSAIASEVVLLEYADQLKADGVLIEKLKALPNVSILTQAKSTLIQSDGKKVVGLEYLDRQTERLHSINLEGVFVQIGLLPNTQFVKGLVELTRFGEVVVDSKGHTSVPGIYAAGDVTTIPFKQIVTAIGDGAKVALTAFEDRMRASVSVNL